MADDTGREEEIADQVEGEERGVGRRAFISGGLAGAVASALVGMRGIAPAAATHGDDVHLGDPILLGQKNVADDTTGLTLEGIDGVAAFDVENPGAGPGIRVVTAEGVGLRAASTGPGLGEHGVLTLTHTGVHGAGRVGVAGSTIPLEGPFTITDPWPEARAGVVGVLTDAAGVGVWGSAVLPDRGQISMTSQVGVLGSTGLLPTAVTFTDTAPVVGVWGTAPPLNRGTPYTATISQTGVRGTAFGSDQVAIVASNPAGTALRVEGGITLNCGGRGVFAARETEVHVADRRIKEASQVIVTLTGDPGNKGCTLHHVEVHDGGVGIRLTAPPQTETPFSYLCFDLAAR